MTDDTRFLTVVLAFTILLCIGVPICWFVSSFTGEINRDQYEIVEELAQREHPELTKVIAEAMSDNKITQSEYRKIKTAEELAYGPKALIKKAIAKPEKET